LGKNKDDGKNSGTAGTDAAAVSTAQQLTEGEGQTAPPPGARKRPPAPPQNSDAVRNLAQATTDKIDQIELEKSRGIPVNRAPVSQASFQEAGAARLAKDLAPRAAASTRHPLAGHSAHQTRPPPTAPTFTGQDSTPPSFGRSTDVLLGDSMLSNAIDLSDSISNRAIEEAAILYANGEVAPAIDVLRESIGVGQMNYRNSLAWRMLLELYQAIGDSKRFKRLAVEYGAQFHDSSPFEPHATADQPSASPVPADQIPDLEGIVFKGPLNASITRDLEKLKRLTAMHQTVCVDFGEVDSVDARGAELTLRILTRFGKSKHTLIVRGGEHLLRRLLAMVESEPKEKSPVVWMLLFEMYRLLGRQDEFEQKSIEYLAILEVSMPLWEAYPPNVHADAAPGSAGEPMTTNGAAGGSTGELQPDMIALRGELLGKADREFARLSEFAKSLNRVCVDCSELTRVDFTAAGAVLNWAVGLHKNNKTIEFRRVSHLVAALLIVMGIHEFAQIERR